MDSLFKFLFFKKLKYEKHQFSTQRRHFLSINQSNQFFKHDNYHQI
ncbi:hypothetical protein OIU79_023376 [Salix purpurea]|uniref:Uncharacterized protein n=1 Tax=Salix purpurea TaxID=77065 RepID=A0A9Q0W911_SALPP|nr:hypothetical protein OIU79_023376 [Salix purpurea]